MSIVVHDEPGDPDKDFAKDLKSFEATYESSMQIALQGFALVPQCTQVIPAKAVTTETCQQTSLRFTLSTNPVPGGLAQ